MNFIQRVTIILAAAALTGGGGQEAAKKKVACTIPAVRSIAAELAGDDFEVFSLAKPDENVHTVSPTPRLMQRVGSADLFIEIGLQLEIWVPEVTNNSGNRKIQPGGEAHVVASAGIPREEIPANPSRSEGDVHPEGNPHIWIDPLRAVRMAENIAAALKKISPAKAEAVDARLEKFRARIDEALFGADLVKLVGSKKLARLAQEGKLWSFLQETEAPDGAKLSTRTGGWLKKAEPLRGQAVIEYHRTWIYLAKLFGFEIVGAIEKQPGIESGPRHILDLIATMKERKARLIIVENFQDVSKPRRLADETGAAVVTVPSQPGGEEGTSDYVAFIDRILAKLVEGLKAPEKK